MKVKECCCGCTLRTGTLIILWTCLVISAGSILFYMTHLLHANYYGTGADSRGYNVRLLMALYYVIQYTAGLTMSVLGLVSIQKNNKKFLFPFYYYILYLIAFTMISIVVLIINSDTYARVFMLSTYSYSAYISIEGKIIIIIAMLFGTALEGYFAVVVKSFYYVMAVNNEGIGFPAQDPVAIGYRNT